MPEGPSDSKELARASAPPKTRAKWLRTAVLIFPFLFLFGLALVLLCSGKSEPVINGVPLRQWVAASSFSQLETVLAAVGPDAIPWLIRGLKAEDSPFYTLKEAAWRKLPRFLQIKLNRFRPVSAENLRANSAFALRFFAPEATNAVPELIRLARSRRDTGPRSCAIQALGEMASDSPAAEAALLTFLRDGDSVFQSQVALVFYFAEWNPREALPMLMSKLKDYHPGPSTSNKPLNEMLALSRYGPEAAAAAPLLVPYITAGEGRGNVLNALKGLGPGAAVAVPRLLQLLDTNRPPMAGDAPVADLQPLVFQILWRIGPSAQAALPMLTNSLQDSDATIRALAATAIAGITTNNDFAVPFLIKELENRNMGNETHMSFNRRNLPLALNHRQVAAWLLGEIGPPAKEALPNLVRATESSTMWLPVFAAQAIWKIEHQTNNVLPALMRSLKTRDVTERVLALKALAELGPAAKPAVPKILATIKLDLKTRREAVEVLKQIDPTALAHLR